jgi:RNA polymerase sigma-70 factor (ECF subfamily)
VPESLDINQLAAARAGDQEAFQQLTEPYRRELLVHCYRLLGSLDDAEDLVQETFLRAWRGLDTFVRPLHFRAWLYKIATNASLNELARRSRRILPNSAYPPGDPAAPLAAPILESVWLQPLPDAWLPEAPADPEARYARQERISLAFALALQLLPPRQRAVLVMCDVLDWSAGETAELLEMTVSAVNSALHRARATLAANRVVGDDEPTQLTGGGSQARNILDQYVRAMQNADVGGLVALLKEAATFTMPPIPTWFRGRVAIGAFLAQALFAGEAIGRWQVLPTGANLQPAFGLYQLDGARGVHQAYALQVLTLDAPGGQIAAIVSFADPRLFGRFNLPLELQHTP